MKTIGIIKVAGVARQAFKLFADICQEYGHLSLGELAEDRFDYGYWILWGVGQ